MSADGRFIEFDQAPPALMSFVKPAANKLKQATWLAGHSELIGASQGQFSVDARMPSIPRPDDDDWTDAHDALLVADATTPLANGYEFGLATDGASLSDVSSNNHIVPAISVESDENGLLLLNNETRFAIDRSIAVLVQDEWTLAASFASLTRLSNAGKFDCIYLYHQTHQIMLIQSININSIN